MFTTILVPLDGSNLAEQALAPAAKLARRTNASILFVRAPSLAPAYATAESAYGLIYPEPVLRRASAEVTDYLKSIQARQVVSGITVRATVAGGEAASAILDEASQSKADLIVMSSHGYSGLTRWLLGSVTEKVLRAATCPVLVVRSSQPLRHMLVTLDGSELSGRVVAPAMAAAQALGASVTLLRVVPEISADQMHELDQYEAGLGPRLSLEMQEDAHGYLQTTINTFDGLGLDISAAVRCGPAASTILEYAEGHAVDLIAMATHGRSGVKRWVYGSVTEKVLRAGGYSMLVVRPQADNLN